MQVVRSGQETSSKLSQLVNDVSKIQSALKELEKRTDYHATKIQCVSFKAPECAVSCLVSTGGGTRRVRLVRGGECSRADDAEKTRFACLLVPCARRAAAACPSFL